MGAGGSKHPEWYPGEPAAEALAECSCQTTAGKQRAETGGQQLCTINGGSTLRPSGSNEASGAEQGRAPAGRSNNGKREASSLPVVELVDLEVRVGGHESDFFLYT